MIVKRISVPLSLESFERNVHLAGKYAGMSKIVFRQAIRDPCFAKVT
jgi:hypothetical protein